MGRVHQLGFDGNTTAIDANIATIDNTLVNSAYSMTTNAKRLLVMAFARQNPNHLLRPGEKLEAVITARQWSAVYTSRRRPFEELESAAHELQRCVLRVHPTTEYYEQWNFTEQARYYPADSLDDARVAITFTTNISTLLSDLFERYTSYDLRMIAELSSFYSTRMYELIAQFRNPNTGCGWIKRSIDKLKIEFEATEKYSRNNDFVKYCLVNPIEEINQKTDIVITYELTKKGRRYDMLHLSFTPKDPLDLPSSTLHKKLPNKKADAPGADRAAISASIMDIKDTDW